MVFLTKHIHALQIFPVVWWVPVGSKLKPENIYFSNIALYNTSNYVKCDTAHIRDDE